jgi:SpoVK/Ycf46/Vps4 family AAA+-type ATPase
MSEFYDEVEEDDIDDTASMLLKPTGSGEFNPTHFKLWSSTDGKSFIPVAKTNEFLPPDVYTITLTNKGPVFTRINFEKETLIRFNDSKIDEVVNEIQTFWSKEDLFHEFGLKFKRGILLYGPPGGGKSSTVKLIVQDVIKKGGIAIEFSNVGAFVSGMRVLRVIQPDTPIVVIMEDIDSILNGPSSKILNILDGIGGFDKIAFLATTNYPEELERRVKNRPSRFDKRYYIDYPNKESRRQYIEYLSDQSEKINIDLDQWVKDTEAMSFAHIKELFISVNLFGRKYSDVLESLRDMSKNISSEDFEMSGVGFGRRRR